MKYISYIAVAFLAFTFTINAVVITDHLVACYPFNSNAADESGNGHDGTVNGAQLTSDRFGNADRAYLFDGSDDYIEVSDSVDLRLANTSYSISTWFKETERNPLSVDALLVKRGSGSQNGWLHAILGESAGVHAGKINIHISAGTDPGGITDAAVPLNVWTHSVLTYDYSTQTTRFYINGELDSEHSNIPSPNPNTDANLFIGKDGHTGSYNFHGSIDDIGIYDKALSAQEVNVLYAAIPEPASIGLIGLVSGCAVLIRRWFMI